MKIKATLLCLTLMLTTALCAQEGKEIALWPSGAPNDNGLTQENEKQNDWGGVDQVANATITVYPAPKPNGMAIIMCPGGGYWGLALRHEGHDMAAWFNTMGITYVVLKYRMPNGHCEIPLTDAEQAIRLVRKHAAEWGVNPHRVGIMGASAGGHLAASLATLYSSEATRPDFQILFYPVISMVKEITHEGSRVNLIGSNPSQELVDKYSLEKQVTAHTPQAFIMLSTDDDTVLPLNSIGYYLTLREHKVPVCLFSYPTGGHGWGFRDNFTYKRQWTGELEKWLREGLVFNK